MRHIDEHQVPDVCSKPNGSL